MGSIFLGTIQITKIAAAADSLILKALHNGGDMEEKSTFLSMDIRVALEKF